MAKNFKAWPKEWPKSLNYPEIPVHAFLEQSAARVPDRIALIFQGMELTYAELRALSGRFAAVLHDLGVQKGDRVAIHLPNCPQFAVAYYGLLRIGAIFTPLSPHLTKKEALFQLLDSGAETLISLDALFPRIQPIISDTNIKRVITTRLDERLTDLNTFHHSPEGNDSSGTLDMVKLIGEYAESPPDVTLNVKEDLAHIGYTGGTTGLSKGVMHTHHNVVANTLQNAHWQNGAQVQEMDGILHQVFPEGVDPKKDRLMCRDQETALAVLPWFHVMGCVLGMNMHIYNGTTMVVMDRFDPGKFLDAIGRYGVTLVAGSPQFFIPLINYPNFDAFDLSGIKIANLGAAPLPRTLLDTLLETFSGVVCDGWGLTECTCGVAVNPPDRTLIRPTSVGIPLFDTECRVVDSDSGEICPIGSEGEICVRGPQVMQGYWNRPDATSEILKDGWLFTGDIGREDEDGFFYITDRKKDMIIYKGYNVYPREIEEVIFRHPAVQQCAVVGKPDEQAGEVPIAYVELKRGRSTTKDDIIEHTNSQVAFYKKVRDVLFMEKIPVSPAGKVLKKELR